MSIRSPAPKPAVAPKMEPRRSAIETSVTSTTSAVPPSGVYADSIETWTSTATKRSAECLQRVDHHRDGLGFLGTSTITDWSEPRSTNGCTWMCLKMSVSVWFTLVTVPIRMSRGKSEGSSLPPGEPAVMIVSPVLDPLVLADPVQDERVGRAAVLEHADRRQVARRRLRAQRCSGR